MTRRNVAVNRESLLIADRRELAGCRKLAQLVAAPKVIVPRITFGITFGRRSPLAARITRGKRRRKRTRRGETRGRHAPVYRVHKFVITFGAGLGAMLSAVRGHGSLGATRRPESFFVRHGFCPCASPGGRRHWQRSLVSSQLNHRFCGTCGPVRWKADVAPLGLEDVVTVFLPGAYAARLQHATPSGLKPN